MTLLHQTARRVTNHAPRLDVLGMRALVKLLRGAGQEPPHGETLYDLTLAGDLVSNALLFSLVGEGNDAVWARGAMIGLGAGVGTALLPPALGLGHPPNERAPQTQIMTVAWYVAGGLIAAGAARWLASTARR